jgi:hypothetical protein
MDAGLSCPQASVIASMYIAGVAIDEDENRIQINTLFLIYGKGH